MTDSRLTTNTTFKVTLNMQENADTAALVDVAESTTRLPVEGTTTADALNSTTSLLTDHDDTSSVSDSAFASSTGSS